MISVEKTIISQYDTSATIVQLVHNIDYCIDPRTDFDTFFSYVWDVSTAQGFGLDTWGRIVNIGRILNVPASTPNPGMFAFTPGAHVMTDTEYRRAILAKALANITNCTADSLNTLLSNLFAGRGRCYVLEMGDMTIQITFEFWLEPYEYVIIASTGAAPVPAGVTSRIFQVDVPNTFGFAEAINLQPFNQGTFYVSV